MNPIEHIHTSYFKDKCGRNANPVKWQHGATRQGPGGASSTVGGNALNPNIGTVIACTGY